VGRVGGDWDPSAPGIGWDGETVNMQPQGVGTDVWVERVGESVWNVWCVRVAALGSVEPLKLYCRRTCPLHLVFSYLERCHMSYKQRFGM
jgi:hypothetical protein